MKNYNFGQTWEIFVTMLAVLFLILLSVGGIITVSQGFSGEKLADDIVETNIEPYVYITPSGGLCEIEIDSGGSKRFFASYDGFTQEIKESSSGGVSDNRTCIQGKFIGYLYESPPIFEKECLEYVNEFSLEAQKEILQIIYLRDLLL